MIWMLEEPYEDEQEDEDDSVDLEALIQSQSSLMGAIANHYHKQGLIPDPNSFMPVAWELEMGPAFAEAQIEANANSEAADSSAPSASLNAGDGWECGWKTRPLKEGQRTIEWRGGWNVPKEIYEGVQGGSRSAAAER